MGKKTNLKATLSKFQEKQRKTQLQKAKESAKNNLALKKAKKPSAKSKGKRSIATSAQLNANSRTIPLKASDTILLVGEGNFSFARALFSSGHDVLAHLPACNVTATTYDSEDACYEKYPDARGIVADLKELGVVVLFGVDARRLEACKELRKRRWQRIVWNFPHAGKGISDQDRNVLSNQLLILDFLKSAASLLEDGAAPSISSRNPRKRKRRGADSDEEDGTESQRDGDELLESSVVKERGTVLVTLRNAPPYTLWDVPRLAKKPPAPHVSSVSPSIPHPRYVQFRSFVFKQDIWQGYEHRMTKGWVEGLGRGGDSAPQKAEDRTWEFYLAE